LLWDLNGAARRPRVSEVGGAWCDARVRHPIYTGILIGFLGTAIALSQVRGVIGFVLILLVLWAKLRTEEEWMRSQFGETYATYAHQTAALVPYLF
jgi:protein-S-isoprenylcysteine O-methyltransferase Ste14